MDAAVSKLAMGLALALLLASQVGSAPRNLEDNVGAKQWKFLGPRGAGPEYILPQTVIPMEYDIQLDVALPDTFTGLVKIIVIAVQEVSFINLHAHAETLDIASVELQRVGDLNSIIVTNSFLQPALDVLVIELGSTLAIGQSYILTIKFNGKLGKDMKGFYRSSYITSSDETRWLAATQFEATNARKAFPCFDEPEYKARFTISIVHDKEFKALSNMPGVTVEEGSKLKTTFKKTPMMCTYLVAFIVSDFAAKENLSNNPPFSVFMREEKLQDASYAVEVGPQTLKKLEQFTGIPFELPKLDLIAIPDFSAGAMENWGLITFREVGLMYQKDESTEMAQESIGLVIAHEEAHMWFGDLVSPAWWGYVWLNEGFARYFQYVSLDMVKPDWRLMETFVVQTLQGAMTVDALETTRPLTCNVYSPDEISAIFDRVTYDKGASVLHMTRNFLGNSAFQKGINRYLKDKQHSIAKPNELFIALNDTAVAGTLPNKTSVGDVLNTWTTQPGFPLVTVKKNKGQLTVTQTRYSSKRSSSEPASPSQWWIPFTLATQKSPNFDLTTKITWLAPNQNETRLEVDEEGWVIANLQETGFYRVNYDNDNWAKISAYLRSTEHEKIHVLNKAQILDDSLTLARSGHLEYPVALELTKYLSNESDPIPWRTALGQFTFLNNMLAGSKAHDSFKTYVLSLMDNVYKLIGFNGTVNDGHLTKVLRISVLKWACNLGNEDCLKQAKEKFEQMKNGTTIIPEIRSAVYCTALRHEDSQAGWDFLWKRYNDPKIVAGEKDVILSSLGCTKNQTQLERFLNMSLDETQVRSQDATAVFTSVLNGNPENIRIAFKFLRDRFKEISASYGGKKSLGTLAEAIAEKLTSKEGADALEKFLIEHQEDLSEAWAAANRAMETARNQQSWTEKYRETVNSWTERANGGSSSQPGSAHTKTSSFLTILSMLICAVLIRF